MLRGQSKNNMKNEMLTDTLLVNKALGVFAKLTKLCLDFIRFRGDCEIGDVVSSKRCPMLRDLRIYNCEGLSNLTILSDSLTSVDLNYLSELEQLNIEAPMLKTVCGRLLHGQPTSGQYLSSRAGGLNMVGCIDPISVHFGRVSQLVMLSIYVILLDKQLIDRPIFNTVQL
uniref:Uncharacterized protein n=1 Tax=Oryza punctata TaxID=4537 RepID=A0A0E0LJ44_ORYPU